MQNKEILANYIEEHFPQRADEIMQKLEKYYQWLVEINQQINLISRKTDPETIWTTHILDSLLIHPFVNLNGKEVLDFGTGGGFPGIPLAILYPQSTIHLLDSKRKKVKVLSEACKEIGITNCRFIHARVEDVEFHYAETFDIILSRSVRITPELKKPLVTICRKGGKIFLYKSIQLEDADLFKKHKVHDVSLECIGTRNIVEINR